jgi:hypothetical protein
MISASRSTLRAGTGESFAQRLGATMVMAKLGADPIADHEAR